MQIVKRKTSSAVKLIWRFHQGRHPMFDIARQEGADQILELGCRVAAELSLATGRTIRVVGWSVNGGKMDQEYVVEIDGQGCNLEVGDSDLLSFSRDERVRAKVEERIRCQMRYGLEIVRPST